MPRGALRELRDSLASYMFGRCTYEEVMNDLKVIKDYLRVIQCNMPDGEYQAFVRIFAGERHRQLAEGAD